MFKETELTSLPSPSIADSNGSLTDFKKWGAGFGQDDEQTVKTTAEELDTHYESSHLDVSDHCQVLVTLYPWQERWMVWRLECETWYLQFVQQITILGEDRLPTLLDDRIG